MFARMSTYPPGVALWNRKINHLCLLLRVNLQPSFERSKGGLGVKSLLLSSPSGKSGVWVTFVSAPHVVNRVKCERVINISSGVFFLSSDASSEWLADNGQHYKRKAARTRAIHNTAN
ncbi:hypothetical protein CEXT_23931 [Caerostris extrusa]|uniref:Uncharacterized protein n=1 Tax=Caerostris extrusa TaxID=172846 RepID=A0AAV4NWP3_CAEEX|nr:hypothetical protein CEXT_23931 [Caerostris extrusa]